MKNYYSILNVSKTAGENEIKRAFRKLALRKHPDHSGGSRGSNAFLLITEARDTLTDSAKRADYDKQLAHKSFSFKPFSPLNKPGKAKHDLAFVKQYIKKKEKPPSDLKWRAPLKVTIPKNQCAKCKGYGVMMNSYDILVFCRKCKGSGRKAGKR